MEKYVAFIDILGFKEKLKSLKHEEAEVFIRSFSTILYDEWNNNELQHNRNINGYIFSDSILVYTEDDRQECLKEMLLYLMEVFKKAFSEKDILLRGGIAKGEFSHLSATSFDNLQKGLVVGRAFVDAYILESEYKGAVILINQAVKDDIEECNFGFAIEEIKNVKNSRNTEDKIYTLRWADIEYLLMDNNVDKLVKLANDSKWLPHYYETIYMFFTKEQNDRKKQEVLRKVYDTIKEKYEWRGVDLFIKNAFSQEVNDNFKKIFLKFLRMNMN